MPMSRLDEEIRRRQALVMQPKRAQWTRLQEEVPEVAALLLLMAKHFGKPASVKVTLTQGEVILKTGAVL
jgi:hypothetical protein